MPQATQSEKLGKAEIRWQASGDDGFSGVVIRGGKRSELLVDDNEQRLVARLRNLAGTQEPNYIGIDDAKARFLEFMPGGFTGDRNLAMERDYKIAAHKALSNCLSAEAALDANQDEATKVRHAPIWTNLLSMYESIHLKETLEGSNGSNFLRAAATFAAGNYSAGAKGMEAAMKAHGRLSWPAATYLPYLWAPERHMFLKPTVTCDFAERIGHPFQYAYEPSISSDTYESLLDLAHSTLTEIQPLGARDLIDVQSFIWVVGAYREDDLPAEKE